MSEQRFEATFNNGFTIELTLDDARSISQPGQDASADIADLRKSGYVDAQLGALNIDDVFWELVDIGAWDADELMDHEKNLDRILWLAGCQIREDNA